MNQSEGQRHDRIRLEVQCVAQQQTITFLEQQLAIAQQQNERLMARLLGGTLPPAPPPGQNPRGAAVHTIQFAPPPSGPFGEIASGLPLPVPPPKGQGAAHPPSIDELADTYVGEHAQALFEDVGDDTANRLGLQHDDVSGTVQRGKRQPLN